MENSQILHKKRSAVRTMLVASQIVLLLPTTTSFGLVRTNNSNNNNNGDSTRETIRPSLVSLQTSSVTSKQNQQQRSSFFSLEAKRNRRNAKYGVTDDDGGMNSWYDPVDENASPDKVFWQEMERQRMSNQLGEGAMSINDPVASIGGEGGGSAGSMDAMQMMKNIGNGGPAPPMGTGVGRSAWGLKPPTMEEQKAAESTLQEYAAFRVKDNWLDEDLQEQMSRPPPAEEEEELTIEEETERLQKQLEALPDGYGTGKIEWKYGDEEETEIWDIWKRDQQGKNRDMDRMGVLEVKGPEPDSEFYLDLHDSEPDPEEEQQAESEFWDRMKTCKLSSRHLQRLTTTESPAAKEFYQRSPNTFQGYDTMWVSAIENALFKTLKGNFRNYGIEFADNFGDFVDGQVEVDSLQFSIEDLAAYKARLVYQATGLPCIASRSSFEIEPIPPAPAPGAPGGGGGGATSPNAPNQPSSPGNKGAYVPTNPRVLSGYKINDIDAHADYICDAMRPMSEPTRVTRFTSCVCYYDGKTEIFDHGVCDVDLHFANGVRTFIPMATAINNLIDTCRYTFGLEFQSFAKKKFNQAASSASTFGESRASLKLRDRVLKDGKVLPNDIIDVSAFMDSQVDVDLMDECAKELANRFVDTKPSKIMTVATTGLVLALPMAKYLQVPVVYARKERNVVMADVFRAGYSSNTVGKNRELLVSKSHVSPKDRILVVDDFLSSGASQEALLRIVNEAEATAVGVGVLLEKVYDSGRQSLSGFNIPIESLCRVASVQNGIIQLLEEEGFVSNEVE